MIASNVLLLQIAIDAERLLRAIAFTLTPIDDRVFLASSGRRPHLRIIDAR
jgi:hypothetical protein